MPRISYVDPATLDGDDYREIFRVAATRGTPRPESQAIRAHVPQLLTTFFATWEAATATGHLESELKELCRLYVSRTVECDYCGSQRSEAFGEGGLAEDDLDDIIGFATSDRFDERQKAALAYTEAITWNPDTADDELWGRLHQHFTEPQIVELGYFVALTSGQQRWIRTMGLNHGEVLGETLAGVVTPSAPAQTARP
ncbi:carboxymuconolactone decarboxylase family protein [Euzebya pacifica]|uniref:carboxymuconolactone decarboxylase family protein n=1 Tax=Euzebya pacifica TaxID=1608957 RepID=UPI0030FBD222